jgi:hypothetical protein
MRRHDPDAAAAPARLAHRVDALGHDPVAPPRARVHVTSGGGGR